MPSEPSGRVPDFIGVGVQRSGTTWIYRNLRRHPDISLFPALKEVHYFNEVHLERQSSRPVTRRKNLDRMERRFEETGRLTARARAVFDELRRNDRDDDWYRLLFSLAPAEKVAGEITPAYSLLPAEGVAHMLSLNPDVRIILMLRHPVDRAWSQVRFTLRRTWFTGHDEPPSDDILRREAKRGRVRRRTAYRNIIETYRSVVPADQLFVSFYDRISVDPDGLLGELATHVGVDPQAFRPPRPNIKARPNAAPDVKMPPGLREEMLSTYRDEIEWVCANVAGAPSAWLADAGT